MKNLLYIILALIFVTSCNEIEVGSTNQNVVTNLTIQVQFEPEFASAPKDGITLSIKDPFGEEFTLSTDENGQAVLPNALVGNYNIVASTALNPEEVEEITGNSSNKELPFNGSISSFSLSADNNTATVTMESAGVIGDLVFKQLYYSGSDNDAGALRDNFIEIYNNSNQVIFIDRWYFGTTERRLSTREDIRDDGVVTTLPDGQYNWAVSLDYGKANTEGDLNKDYIYARDLYQFPGNGQDYPINPGESIVIAKIAVNHKLKPGTNEPVPLPDLTVDLSTSDFEIYYDNRFDLDNPSVPNMTIIQERRTGGNDLTLDGFGRNGFFLLKNTANIAAYGEVLRPEREAKDIGSTRYYFRQIPVSDIVDGVDGNRFDEDRQVAKVFPNAVDAGWVSNSGGLRSSEALIRKITVASANNERKVLQDTNNSFDDFQVIFPNPKGF